MHSDLYKTAKINLKFLRLFKRGPRPKTQAAIVQELLADLKYKRNNPMLFPEMLGESRAKALAAERSWVQGLGKASFSKYAALRDLLDRQQFN